MIRILNTNGVILNTKDKYCTNNIEVAVDPTNIVPENIVKGKAILGVTGTYEGSIPEGYIKPEGTIKITKNGIHDITSYAAAEINVPIPEGYIIPEGTIEITANGDHDITNYKTASVNVPIPEGYIIPEGSLAITANGDYNITSYATVNVNVEGGGGEDTLTALMTDTLEEYKTSTPIFIEKYSFCKKYNLRTVDAPITEFKQYGFTESYIDALVIRNTELIPISSSSYIGIYGDFQRRGRIFVPDNLVDSYKSATNWSSYASIIYPISSYNPIAPKLTEIEKIQYYYSQDPINYNGYTSWYASGSYTTTILKYKINVPEGSDGKFGIYLKATSGRNTSYVSKLDTVLTSNINESDAVIKISDNNREQTYIYENVSVGEHFVTVASKLSSNTSVEIYTELIPRP